MKKILSVVAIVFIMGGCLVSCGNNKACYEIQYTSGGTTMSMHFWGTKMQAEAASLAQGSDAKVTKTSKTESECLAF